MTYRLNQTEARSHARSNLTIFDEVNSLMRQVIVASDAGAYQLIVSDGTTFTNSTPDITVTGTIANPTITGTPTVILAGATITLGTTGTSIDAVVADINNANVTGLTASKNSSGQLQLVYSPSAANWEFVIGAGTANTALGLAGSTNTPTSPASANYFSVWTGSVTDRKADDEMQQVIKYFKNLGFNIVQRTNSTTNKTFNWEIYW